MQTYEQKSENKEAKILWDRPLVEVILNQHSEGTPFKSFLLKILVQSSYSIHYSFTI